jgi:hypothetical protein
MNRKNGNVYVCPGGVCFGKMPITNCDHARGKIRKRVVRRPDTSQWAGLRRDTPVVDIVETRGALQLEMARSQRSADAYDLALRRNARERARNEANAEIQRRLERSAAAGPNDHCPVARY